jgi:hypothetical protein
LSGAPISRFVKRNYYSVNTVFLTLFETRNSVQIVFFNRNYGNTCKVYICCETKHISLGLRMPSPFLIFVEQVRWLTITSKEFRCIKPNRVMKNAILARNTHSPRHEMRVCFHLLLLLHCPAKRSRRFYSNSYPSE